MSWSQRFAGKVNDPLWVRVFRGRPLGKPIREGGVAYLRADPACLGAALFLQEAWEALSLAECLEPCLPDLDRLILILINTLVPISMFTTAPSHFLNSLPP